MADSQTINTLANSNLAYTNESALNMRLSTDALLYQIEQNLKGIKLVPEQINEQGITTYKEIKLADVKMNDTGVQSIMMFISGIINTATVQGNWDSNRYSLVLYRTRRDLAMHMTNCCARWGLDESYMELICDLIMCTFEAFLSRLIENKERESYSNTVSVKETNTVNQQGVKV